MPPANDNVVDRKRLAEVLGLDVSMINKLAKQGLPKEARGKYSLPIAVQWYVNSWRDRVESKSKTMDESRKRLYQEQTEKHRLENEKLRGELLPVEDVQHIMNEVAVTVATQLDGLGPRMAQVLAGMDEPAEIQRTLLHECRDIRFTIAGQVEAIADIEDGSEHHKTPTKKKRRGVGGRKKKATARKSRARKVANK